eukprot:82163-Chlamydomonas_euryale.AAC.2
MPLPPTLPPPGLTLSSAGSSASRTAGKNKCDQRLNAVPESVKASGSLLPPPSPPAAAAGARECSSAAPWPAPGASHHSSGAAPGVAAAATDAAVDVAAAARSALRARARSASARLRRSARASTCSTACSKSATGACEAAERMGVLGGAGHMNRRMQAGGAHGRDGWNGPQEQAHARGRGAWAWWVEQASGTEAGMVNGGKGGRM